MAALTARTRRLAVAVGVLAVLAVVAVVVSVTSSSDGPAPRARHRAAATPAAATTPPARPSTTSRSTAVPVPHDVVPAAAPRRFALSGPGFTIRAKVCGMANVRPLNPPGDEHNTVCWVRQDFGVAPGSSTATTYVLGHAWAQDPNEVLNKASSRATRDVLRAKVTKYDGVPVYQAPSMLGTRLTLDTPQGRLTYTVRRSYGVAKAKAGTIRTLMDQGVRNRVVLITCAERHGTDYDYNIVLEAFLTSSQRTTSRS